MNSWIASLPFVSSPKKGDCDKWVVKDSVVQKGVAGHDSETSIIWSEAPGNNSIVFGSSSPNSKYPKALPGVEGMMSISLEDVDVFASPSYRSPQASPTRGKRLGPSYFLSKSLSVRNILSPRRDKAQAGDKSVNPGLFLPFREAAEAKPVAPPTAPSTKPPEPVENATTSCGIVSRKEYEMDFCDLIEEKDEVTLETCETSAPTGHGASLRSRLHRSISEFFSSKSEIQCEIDLDDIFEAKHSGSLEPCAQRSSSKASTPRECTSADSRLSMLHRSMSEIFVSKLSGGRSQVARVKKQSEAVPARPPTPKADPPPALSRTKASRCESPGSKHSDLHRSMSEIFSSRSNGRCQPKRQVASSRAEKQKKLQDSSTGAKCSRLPPATSRKAPQSPERRRAQRRHSMPTYSAEMGLQDLLDAYDMIMNVEEIDKAPSEPNKEGRTRESPVFDSHNPKPDQAVEPCDKIDETSKLHDETTVTEDDDDDDDSDDDDDDEGRSVSYLRPAMERAPRRARTSRRLERGLSLLAEKDEEPESALSKPHQSHLSLFESTGW